MDLHLLKENFNKYLFEGKDTFKGIPAIRFEDLPEFDGVGISSREHFEKMHNADTSPMKLDESGMFDDPNFRKELAKYHADDVIATGITKNVLAMKVPREFVETDFKVFTDSKGTYLHLIGGKKNFWATKPKLSIKDKKDLDFMHPDKKAEYIRTFGRQLSPYRKFINEFGILHRSNIAFIVSDNGYVYDLDRLKGYIKTPPTNVVTAYNQKMTHGSDAFTRFISVGVPAARSIIVDEDTNQFVVIKTCPGAGECIIDCYALKGSFITFKHSSLSRAKILNLLVNRPDEYKERVINEIQTVLDAYSKANKEVGVDDSNVQVYLRIHDSGDFFNQTYYDIMRDVASAHPNVILYFYTKTSYAALDKNLPKNVFFRVSNNGNKGHLRAMGNVSHTAGIISSEVFDGSGKYPRFFKFGKNGVPQTYTILNPYITDTSGLKDKDKSVERWERDDPCL